MDTNFRIRSDTERTEHLKRDQVRRQDQIALSHNNPMPLGAPGVCIASKMRVIGLWGCIYLHWFAWPAVNINRKDVRCADTRNLSFFALVAKDNGRFFAP